MQKDFTRWHGIKLQLDRTDPTITYKEREVWWMMIGHNVGSEQNGSTDTFSRPVLIVKGFSKTMFWGIPLSNTKNRSRYVVPIMLGGVERAASISQIRALGSRRIGDRIGMISESDMRKIKNKIIKIVSE